MKTNRRSPRWIRETAYWAARFWENRVVLAVALAYWLVFAWLFGGGDDLVGRPIRALAVPEAPVWERPGEAHWFGTTGNGTDLFELSRSAMATTTATAVLACSLGTLLGLVIAMLFLFDPGERRFVLLRGASRIVGTTPSFVLLCLVVGGADGGFLISALAFILLVALRVSVDLADWFDEEDERDDLVAGAVLGLHRPRLLKSRVIPRAWGRMVGLFAMTMPVVMLAEMALAFLGLNGDAFSCGTIIASGRAYLVEAPWVTIYPGLLAGLVVLVFAILGRWVCALLDVEEPPRWM